MLAGPLFAAGADLSADIDHAVPGDPAPIIERAQRVADETRLAGQTRQPRDLAIGCDSAARNARDYRIDPLVVASRRRHGREDNWLEKPGSARFGDH
jgi:hypothetical protein